MISSNDTISLDDDDIAETTNPEKMSKELLQKYSYLIEILGDKASIEIIIKCESCGDTLRDPMVIITKATDDDDEQRDSSIVCDNNCA